MIIHTDIGKISVLEQAITTMVSVVARLESGIILLSTGAVDSLIKHVSGKKMHKGVSVTFSNSKLIIELRIVVPYFETRPKIMVISRTTPTA